MKEHPLRALAAGLALAALGAVVWYAPCSVYVQRVARAPCAECAECPVYRRCVDAAFCRNGGACLWRTDADRSAHKVCECAPGHLGRFCQYNESDVIALMTTAAWRGG